MKLSELTTYLVDLMNEVGDVEIEMYSDTSVPTVFYSEDSKKLYID